MPKQVTVEEGSASPPPLPKEPIPEASSSGPIASGSGPERSTDIPVSTLGDENEHENENKNDGDGEDQEDQVRDNADAEDEEWDPSEERLPGQSTSAKGKGKAVESDTGGQPWQAVWAAEQNAWYFWNSITGEVTWTNPLEPAPPLPNEPAPPPLPQEAPPLPAGHFGQVPDIDPDLAYLLPSTQRGGLGAGIGGGGGGAAGTSEGQSAAFNARTGRFLPTDNNYSVDHLEEWNRAKRQAGKYFDVESWEQSVREENAKRKREAEMGGGEDKKVSKKDLERFKKKKAEQKLRKQAWLRD